MGYKTDPNAIISFSYFASESILHPLPFVYFPPSTTSPDIPPSPSSAKLRPPTFRHSSAIGGSQFSAIQNASENPPTWGEMLMPG